jgi:hypothetical protein
MLAAFFRLFVFVVVIAALGMLFFYAFLAALIVTPILFVLFWLFGRKSGVQWVVRTGSRAPPGQGPIIDHDPTALPPQDDSRP